MKVISVMLIPTLASAFVRNAALPATRMGCSRMMRLAMISTVNKGASDTEEFRVFFEVRVGKSYWWGERCVRSSHSPGVLVIDRRLWECLWSEY